PVEPPRRHHPRIVLVEIALLRLRKRVLIPRMARVDGVPERIFGYEDLASLPILVEGMPEQNAQSQIDVHEIRRDELSVDDHPRGHEHSLTPFGHRLVFEVADLRILECPPAPEQNAPIADFLVTGHGLVEEVEEVIVQRDYALHELDITHQPH